MGADSATRQTSVSTVGTYGTAVGPYQVLAIARPLVNAVSVQARRYGQNEYIPATIKVIDYEYNLCLIELDKNAAGAPLKPLEFKDKYQKGKDLRAYWLSSGGQLTTARATLDRADVRFSNISFVRTLQYVLSNPSRSTGSGEVYCLDDEPIGIACWSNDTEAGVIPAESINRFLKEASQPPYRGFGAAGFETTNLLDPAIRKFLKMPDDLRHGVFVSSMYAMGTGSRELKSGDVILSTSTTEHSTLMAAISMNGTNGSTGTFAGPKGLAHARIVVWRGAQREQSRLLCVILRPMRCSCPTMKYGRRPEYLVVAGFVFQKLTRELSDDVGRWMAGAGFRPIYINIMANKVSSDK